MRRVAAIFTLMEQFAELVAGATDPGTGANFQRLAPHHQEACSGFFEKIAKSALIEHVAAYDRENERQDTELGALVMLQGVKDLPGKVQLIGDASEKRRRSP